MAKNKPHPTKRVMKRYTAWLPTYASAKYEWVTDEEFESEEDFRDTFVSKATPVGSGLCHRCSEEFDLDDVNNIGDVNFSFSYGEEESR